MELGQDCERGALNQTRHVVFVRAAERPP